MQASGSSDQYTVFNVIEKFFRRALRESYVKPGSFQVEQKYNITGV